VFTSPQVVLLLTRLVLEHAPDVEGDLNPRAAGAALLAAADATTLAAFEDSDVSLDWARNDLFYSRPDAKLLWGRSERMWLEIAPRVRVADARVDVGETILDAVGVPLGTYMALGAAAYLKCFRAAQDDWNEGYWTPDYIGEVREPPEVVQGFVASYAETRDWFRREIEGITLPWDFTPLRRRPLLRHGSDVAAFSAYFLLEKGTDGIYYTVMDHLRDRGHDVLTWTRTFGRIWEAYVCTLLDEALPGERLIRESDLKRLRPGAPACERVVLYPGRALLVEAAGKRITLPSAATGKWEDMERDFELAVVDKARQLSGTIEWLAEDPSAVGAEPGEPLRFLPLIVLPGPFPRVPPVEARLRAAVGRDPRCRAMRRLSVDPFLVLDGKDFEMLVGTSMLGASAIDLLDAWQSSGLAAMSFWNWITSEWRRPRGWPASLERASERLLDRATELFVHDDEG